MHRSGTIGRGWLCASLLLAREHVFLTSFHTSPLSTAPATRHSGHRTPSHSREHGRRGAQYDMSHEHALRKRPPAALGNIPPASGGGEDREQRHRPRHDGEGNVTRPPARHGRRTLQPAHGPSLHKERRRTSRRTPRRVRHGEMPTGTAPSCSCTHKANSPSISRRAGAEAPSRT